jgi:hypothetical protein
MKLILAIPAAGLLLSGSLQSLQHPGIAAASQPISLKAPTSVAANQPRMWTAKEYLYKDEAFELHFEMPHAANLGVIDPEGKFFYVIFPEANSVGKLRPLVSSEQFAHMSTLKINSRTFKADPYTHGVLENQPVFRKPGTYRFVLGNDLHTDDESTLAIVRVQYSDAKRPAANNGPAR